MDLRERPYGQNRELQSVRQGLVLLSRAVTEKGWSGALRSYFLFSHPLPARVVLLFPAFLWALTGSVLREHAVQFASIDAAMCARDSVASAKLCLNRRRFA